MTKPIRVLDHWSKTSYGPIDNEKNKEVFVECDEYFIVSGNVMSDTSGKMAEGWHCQSTIVLKWDEKNQTAETANTIYRLVGKEGGDEIKQFAEHFGLKVTDVFY